MTSLQERQVRAAKIFAILKAENPEPKTELEYTNPYTLLVAVVLSAQATDKGVNKATPALFAAADNPKAMLQLGEEKLLEMVKTIGLYKGKAKNIIVLSQKLLDLYNGEVPNDQKALEALPGVGRKTANVVRNAAFGEKTLAVDTHVFRVAHRLGFSEASTPDGVEDDLMQVVPDEYMQHAHHWLILHGRYTCVARKPLCLTCPIAAYCPSAGKV